MNHEFSIQLCFKQCMLIANSLQHQKRILEYLITRIEDEEEGEDEENEEEEGEETYDE